MFPILRDAALRAAPQDEVACESAFYEMLVLEVSRFKKPFGIAVRLGQVMPKAKSVAMPYLPFAVGGLDCKAAWITFAAKTLKSALLQQGPNPTVI